MQTSIRLGFTNAMDIGSPMIRSEVSFIAFGTGLEWNDAVVKIRHREEPRLLGPCSLVTLLNGSPKYHVPWDFRLIKLELKKYI